MKTFAELFNDYWKEFSDREVTKEDFEETFLDGMMYNIFKPFEGIEIMFGDVYDLVDFEEDENLKRLNSVESSEFMNECHQIVCDYVPITLGNIITELQATLIRIENKTIDVKFK